MAWVTPAFVQSGGEAKEQDALRDGKLGRDVFGRRALGHHHTDRLNLDGRAGAPMRNDDRNASVRFQLTGRNIIAT